MSSGNSDAAPPNVWSQWLVNTGRRVASTLGDILDDSGHASTGLSAPTTTPTEVGYVDNLLRSQGNSTAGLREYLEGKHFIAMWYMDVKGCLGMSEKEKVAGEMLELLTGLERKFGDLRHILIQEEERGSQDVSTMQLP
ncbi:hypothetical protein TREMEDRAFT_59248 [Tremella mesenterica DSM 1558]|uniref:uncharacterized protein n=1 Tax=Tremella mesenterica (strain ATCC 24925 / CBS 8224 / DSM 1558 / NBRC 9311 / NRRL Y-6157 / RJB 2259-6 / UBC 559-6) TaxID=578456 RepID=UPI0003F4968A|nr:uncharacterized protein TREMEDRAFT_59248 [Tremella mesenterica DSM 1558]EIW73086.1 hypothetical protein TREMEDRAFT_59248 [Tremella mesenterica DSM 1558]